VLGFVLLVDNEHILLPLVDADRLIGYEQPLKLLADGEPDAGELPGGEPAVFVGEDAAHPDRAGRWVKLVLGEVDDAFAWKTVAVADQTKEHGDHRRFVLGAFSKLLRAPLSVQFQRL